jgi:hypothetical protein
VKQERQCIYEWRAWDGYLLPMLCDEPVRITARIGESDCDVLQQIPPDVGVVAFHLNLTHTAKIPSQRPRMTETLRGQGRVVLNSSVTSISKHDVQRTCAEAGLPTTRAECHGDPDEILILKTDRNYGGEKELQLTVEERQYLGMPPHDLWSPGHDGYRTLRRGDVPEHHWNVPDVTVERFVENRRHVFYRCYVAGASLVVSRVIDPSPLKKMPIGIERTSWFLDLRTTACMQGGTTPPGHVVAMVRRFCLCAGLDFGALDVVEDDFERCYIVDVNTTPHWGDGGHPDLLRFLTSGLRDFGDRFIAPASDESPGTGMLRGASS